MKTIIDINDSSKFDFNFQLHNRNDLVTDFKEITPPNRISQSVVAFINNDSGRKTMGSHSFEIQPNLGLILPQNVIQQQTNGV